MANNDTQLRRTGALLARLAALLLLAVPLAACDTVFPEREGFDAGGGGGGGNGGSGGNPDEQVYGYNEGCNCSQGYRNDPEYGGRQYTCFASGGTWREARDNCARQGMRLVTPASADETDFVVDLCSEGGDGGGAPERWWIGAQDVLTDGTFVDEGGQPVVWEEAWAADEPAADVARDCAAMDRDGEWSVSACEEKRAYVCATPSSNVSAVPTGAACSQLGTTTGCGGAQRCFEASADLGVGVCTFPCDGDDECVEGTRCTTTPEGRLCLKRCEETWECAAVNGNLRCIHTPGGDGVCWTQGAPSGEVQTAPDVVLDHIEFDTGSGRGWPRPGEQSVLHVFIRNDGDGDAFDARGTVSPVGELFVDELTNDTGSLVPVIPAGGEAVEIVTPTVVLSSDLPLGTPARFLLTVNAGTAQWQIEFGVTAYPSAALPWVTAVTIAEGEAIAPGATGSVSLLAENLGFAAVSEVSTVVVVEDGAATWTPTSAGTVSFQDPTVNPNTGTQQVAAGTVAVDAGQPSGQPIVLYVTMTEPGGTVWEQTVEVPVE